MTNKFYERGKVLTLPVGSGVVSGDPVLVGGLPGVAATTYSATAPLSSYPVAGVGGASVDMEGVFLLSVQAVDSNGNVAVAVGDKIYYTTGDTPVLGKKTGGVFFGIALGAITSGSTLTIPVLIGGAAQAGSGKPFVSTEQTGTGSAQNIAHGLGVKPSAVLITPTDLTPSTVGSYSAVEGTHTTTNVVVTVTASKKFKVAAWY